MVRRLRFFSDMPLGITLVVVNSRFLPSSRSYNTFTIIPYARKVTVLSERKLRALNVAVASYQLAGFVTRPLASAKVSGNMLAFKGPWRRGLYHEAALCSSKLRLRLGSKTPICFPSLVRAILTGSSRSESLETTTANSSSSSKPSINKWDARLTSEPFSSVSSTSTVRGPVSGCRANGLRLVFDRKCP